LLRREEVNVQGLKVQRSKFKVVNAQIPLTDSCAPNHGVKGLIVHLLAQKKQPLVYPAAVL
jgi:hypothetical protein